MLLWSSCIHLQHSDPWNDIMYFFHSIYPFIRWNWSRLECVLISLLYSQFSIVLSFGYTGGLHYTSASFCIKIECSLWCYILHCMFVCCSHLSDVLFISFIVLYLWLCQVLIRVIPYLLLYHCMNQFIKICFSFSRSLPLGEYTPTPRR